MKKLFVLLACLLPAALQAQEIGNYLGDETLMYAETKQMSQFFRRFNNEEDTKGKRYEPDSKAYRSNYYRPQYINMLFDGENASIGTDLKRTFVEEVTAGQPPQFLEFRGDDWFAEVVADFKWKGKPVKVNIFLKLEQENLGYKWVMSNVYFEPFAEMFEKHEDASKHFLHPMSHEIDFMNLIRVFNNKQHLADYASRAHKPDYLTLFLYESMQGNLSFENISKVKFHFFQIDGWYFEVSEFNREGYNTGWLISNLTQVEAAYKDVLLEYILHRS